MDFVQNFKDIIITNLYLIISVILITLLVWNISITITLSKLTNKYKKLTRGTSGKNIEQLISDKYDTIDKVHETVDNLNGEMKNLKNQLDKCVQKQSIIRYNAFSDTGSDLSYSIALMDNYNNGFVLTGIYGRNESVTYAKPIELGKSKYPLSNEEELVLKRSIKKI